MHELVFSQLKRLLEEYVDSVKVTVDEKDHYSLFTEYIMKNKKALFFAAVKINKSYVSFHLMPVYVFPELLEGVSEKLRKRMQGKSCFNFKEVDQGLFNELDKLTKIGLEKYREAGYLV